MRKAGPQQGCPHMSAPVDESPGKGPPLGGKGGRTAGESEGEPEAGQAKKRLAPDDS